MSNVKNQSMPLGLGLLPILFTVSLIAIQLFVFNSFDPQVPLLFGIFLTACIGVIRGWKWRDMESGMFNIVIISLPTIAILLLIGVIISTWIASGTVPYLVYYGLKIISPQYFLVTGFFICSLMSLALGTAWGTLGTLGIVLVGIGETMGFPLYMTVGAVVAGSFFGDKMSPISDTTNLAPAVTGTNVFDHVRGMIPTTVPAMVIGMIVYLVIGLLYHPATGNAAAAAELSQVIEANFKLNILVLLPPIIIAILAIRGFAAIPAMFGGVFSAFLLAIFLQDVSIAHSFDIILNGFSMDTSSEISSRLFNRGGLTSMTGTLAMVFLALTFGGLLERLGCFDAILKAILPKIKHFWQLQISTIVGTMSMVAGTGDNYLPMAFIGRLFSQAYDKFGYSRLNLSRGIEEGGTLVSPLIPWSASGIFIAANMGINVTDAGSQDILYIPFAIGCWLSPLLGIVFPIFGWFSKKSTPEEVAAYSDNIDNANLSEPVKKFLHWYNPPAGAYISTPQIALDRGIRDVAIPVRDILEKGDFGYGKAGEKDVIILDNAVYTCSNNMATLEEDDLLVNAINLTHYSSEIREEYRDTQMTVTELLNMIRISANCIYSYRIEGRFTNLVFEDGSTVETISGTVLGFYYPQYMESFAAGLNLFFIGGDNFTTGGKVTDANIDDVVLDTKQLPKITSGLPITLDFLLADLSTK